MKKLVKTAVAMMVLFFSITLLPATNVEAKKLTVNKVYTASDKVEGKTKSKYKVKVKIGKKTYRKKAKKSGKFSIPIPKQKAGKKIKVKTYKKKKNGKWKLVKTKTVKVKKPKINTLKNMAIADANSGTYHGATDADVKAGKDYIHNGGNLKIGDWEKYIEQDEPRPDEYGITKYVGIKAKNGATLYVNVFYGGRVQEWYEGDLKDLKEGVNIGKTREELEAWYQRSKQYNYSFEKEMIPEPTTTKHDYKITSGNEVKFYAKDYPKIGNAVSGHIYFKAYAYVNNKLVAVSWDSLRLAGIKGTFYESRY